MTSVVEQITSKQKKSAIVDVRSGDTVRVHQKIREGGKERVQIFEGMVIKVSRKSSLTSSFTVRRVASGVGVEKSYLIHSPNVLKVEIMKRGKVRRNYLTYMRELTGKGTRLSGIDFDKDAVNAVHDEAAEAEEAKLKEETAEAAEEHAEQKAEAEKELEVKAEAAIAAHDQKDVPAPAKEQSAEKAGAKRPTGYKDKEKK